MGGEEVVKGSGISRSTTPLNTPPLQAAKYYVGGSIGGFHCDGSKKGANASAP
jgi:hypothetical protein